MGNGGAAHKKQKRRGSLKLATFSYRKPNPWLLIPSHQSLVTSHSSLLSNFMTKLCIKILVKSDSVIESAFP